MVLSGLWWGMLLSGCTDARSILARSGRDSGVKAFALGVLLFTVLGCATFVGCVYIMKSIHTDVVHSCTIGD
jgi:hypothetical protein